jgi:hypothetical protein
MGPILLATAALAAAIAGCGSAHRHRPGDVTPPPFSETVTPSPPPIVTPDIKNNPRHRTDSDGNGILDRVAFEGRVGDTFMLEGPGLHDAFTDRTHTSVRVTLWRVRGPSEDTSIPAGERLVTVELRVHNVGRLPYVEPRPRGQLDLDHALAGTQLLLGADTCRTAAVKLGTGESTTVCLAFRIPRAGRLQAFAYATDDGFGDIGLWDLH